MTRQERAAIIRKNNRRMKQVLQQEKGRKHLKPKSSVQESASTHTIQVSA